MMRQRLWPFDILGLLCLLASASGFCGATDSVSEDEEGPVLLGPLSRDEVEAAAPEFVFEEVSASPDLEATEALLSALEGAQITVFLGTWCSDSHRELGRLWRAFDELGVLNPDQIRYIGVDRDKREPASMLPTGGLRLVPTFVVQRGGGETGRIVESAPNGIENDLLALLHGERTGVISASEDLELEKDEH